jgi:sulfite exporter TauE/SafE
MTGNILRNFQLWTWAIPGLVFVASISGSMHCIAMCGGIVSASCKSVKDSVFYHLGRALGYAILGLIAGLLGARTLNGSVAKPIQWVAASTVGFCLIWIGFETLRGKSVHLPLPKILSLGVMAGMRKNIPWLTGFSSAFLPCSWLYSFVLAAVATQDPVHGALVLLAFWGGTVPALLFLPSLVKKTLSPIANRFPMLSGSALVLAGVLTVFLKVQPLLSSGAHCAHHLK